MNNLPDFMNGSLLPCPTRFPYVSLNLDKKIVDNSSRRLIAESCRILLLCLWSKMVICWIKISKLDVQFLKCHISKKLALVSPNEKIFLPEMVKKLHDYFWCKVTPKRTMTSKILISIGDLEHLIGEVAVTSNDHYQDRFLSSINRQWTYATI